jgi:hypothetical protein
METSGLWQKTIQIPRFARTLETFRRGSLSFLIRVNVSFLLENSADDSVTCSASALIKLDSNSS